MVDGSLPVCVVQHTFRGTRLFHYGARGAPSHQVAPSHSREVIDADVYPLASLACVRAQGGGRGWVLCAACNGEFIYPRIKMKIGRHRRLRASSISSEGLGGGAPRRGAGSPGAGLACIGMHGQSLHHVWSWRFYLACIMVCIRYTIKTKVVYSFMAYI
eukprot:SAG31_NODE_838_length_11617_cov_36.512936_16_plen_159_part_00